MLFPAAVGVQSTAVVIEDKERTCDSLLMCIVTVLSHGLRSGGGVGDVLRKPSKEVPHKGLNMKLSLLFGLWKMGVQKTCLETIAISPIPLDKNTVK